MYSLIVEVKLQFSNKFVEIAIMKTIIIWDTAMWLEIFKLLAEKHILSDFKRCVIITMLVFLNLFWAGWF